MVTNLYFFIFLNGILPRLLLSSLKSPQPFAPSTCMMPLVGTHRPASRELMASWAACYFFRSCTETKLLAQHRAQLCCTIVEFPLVTMIHSYPRWQRIFEVASTLNSEIIARELKCTTPQMTFIEKKKCHVLKGAQVAFLDPNYSIANINTTNVELQ